MVEPSTDAAVVQEAVNPQIVRDCQENFIPESSLAYQP